jgi:hypothetical protein
VGLDRGLARHRRADGAVSGLNLPVWVGLTVLFVLALLALGRMLG